MSGAHILIVDDDPKVRTLLRRCFEGEGFAESGTVGAVDIPNVPTDAAGHFHISFTIPAQLHSLQGRGGGPVRPGTYDFVSKPVACLIQFTVTAS